MDRGAVAEEPFESGEAPRPAVALIVDLDGYEGPLDVLLALAREHRVDLTRISILDLAEQYLAFIADARGLRLEIAADYLVMAAWLAYLKSRLLLPETEVDEEPSVAEMAAALAFRLRRLEAMREAAARLMGRDRLGRDMFARGAPEGVRVVRSSVFELSLYELLKAYAEHSVQRDTPPFAITPAAVYSVQSALGRLGGLLGGMADWTRLEACLPPELAGDSRLRSALASTFAASLELARSGEVELRQSDAFGPIHLRRPPGED